MIEYGIPYFGESNNEILNYIYTTEYDVIVHYDSFYDFILDTYLDTIILPTTTTEGSPMLWVKDIIFDYKHRECYLPYWEYDLELVDKGSHRKDNKGHIRTYSLEDRLYLLRYNFRLEKQHITLENPVSLKCCRITEEGVVPFTATFDKWYPDSTFSMNDLYEAYIDSCFWEDGILIGHEGGYHFIDRSPKGFNNIEKLMREERELLAYKGTKPVFEDYRDVRNYKYIEVVQKVGLRETFDTYKIRRFKFESLLYCIIAEGALPTEQEVLPYWKRLKTGKVNLYKYGKDIKLILKDYWFTGVLPTQTKTWSRF